MFTGFLVGFITVLCIGNYFRAKRAQERQRQRRLAKLNSAAQQQSSSTTPDNIAALMSKTGGSTGTPRSGNAGNREYNSGLEAGVGGGYEAPNLSGANGIRA